jgi:hypothetical protein
MEDQNDLADPQLGHLNVVTGGKGDKAEIAAQPLLCTGGGTRGKASLREFRIPACLSTGTTGATQGFPGVSEENQGPDAQGANEGWAISILLEAGAICECEEHGWMKDRTDP